MTDPIDPIGPTGPDGAAATGGHSTVSDAAATGGDSTVGGAAAAGGDSTVGGAAATGGDPTVSDAATAGGDSTVSGAAAAGGDPTVSGAAATGGDPTATGAAATGGDPTAIGPAAVSGAGPAPDAAAEDERWMRRALQLAARGRGRTSPNPAVGCVIVAGGRPVGEGFHPRAGQPHAEVFALDAAGEAARGATLYVTLEPCAHWGRTPPCADRIVEAGVRRVVAAMVDPDARVSGGGLRRLRAAGVEVATGCLEAEARELNAAYIAARTRGRPFFLLKYAMTLDGRLHARGGDARWVSGEESRRRAHELRDWMDAVLVGVGTVLADDPQLTCRIPGGRDPLRVIADTRARTPPGARALGPGCLVAVGPAAPDDALRRLQETGADVARLPAGPGGGVDLHALAAELLRRGVLGVLAEGGPALLRALADGALCDRVVCFLAPKLIGGRGAMAGALSAAAFEAEPSGADWMLTARGPFVVHGAD